jgi:hypothetical protein
MKALSLIQMLAASCAMCAAPAFANLIQVPGNQVNGTGLGAVQTLVTVQDNDKSKTDNGVESGCVSYSGNLTQPNQTCELGLQGGDNTAGNAGSNTYLLSSIQHLPSAGNLALVVNISEGQPGGTATLTHLYLSLLNLDTNVLKTFAYAEGPLVLGDSGGVGQSGDNLFILDPAQAAQANSLCPDLTKCVVGGGIQFAYRTTEATPETTYIASITRRPVPEPMTLALLGLGLLGMMGVMRRPKV